MVRLVEVSKNQLQLILDTFESAQDRLVLQHSDLSLETLAAMVEGGAIDIQPHYQRRDRWGGLKRSRLIESFLLNIPVPPIYLSEDQFGTYSVIDGKQRLTAIRSFMRNEFALAGMETFHAVETLLFCELPDDLQNALKIRPYLRVVTLLKQSDKELKYDVFERLNTGGETLNAQEIRNVAFHGPLNDLIYSTLCGREFLTRRLKISTPPEKSPAFQKMQDAEYVLRYLTLRSGWETFSGDLAKSMDDFMSANQYASEKPLNDFKSDFDRALKWCEVLWGDKAFARPTDDGWRDQSLAGMYDAEMIAVARLPESKLKLLADKRSQVVQKTRSLFSDPEFDTAVRQGTNTPSRVRFRIASLHDALLEIAK